jgi:toxin-antitoxin system PIN domain toxin
VKLVDANVLLYAVDRGSTHHALARDWLDRALNGPETILLPWVSLLAFVRLSTHPGIYERPLAVDQALDTVALWLAQPVTVAPEPDARHITHLRDLLAETGRGGNLVNDAHLAALALQHRATVVTFDNDFGRFPGVRWERPAVD